MDDRCPPEQTIAVNTLPFWSNFVLGADLRYIPGSSRNLVLTAGSERNVFSYKQSDTAVAALEGANATKRDTGLIQSASTPGGSRFRIQGISITPDGMPFEYGQVQTQATQDMAIPAIVAAGGPGADAILMPSPEDYRSLANFLVALMAQNTRLILQVDGTARNLELGPAVLYNAVGGLFGDNAASVGQPFAANYYPIPEGIVWKPQGGSDSNMVCSLVAAYNVQAPSFPSADGINPATGQPYANGAQANPLGRYWRQRFCLNFHGQREAPTSKIS